MDNGLYEQVISNYVKEQIELIDNNGVQTRKIDSADAPMILSDYVQEIVCSGMKILSDDDDGTKQINLANRIIDLVNQTINEEGSGMNIEQKGEQLLAIYDDAAGLRITEKNARSIIRPETSISYSSLFTGAQREPQLYSEIAKEIATSDQIDILVSFIRWSGLSLILDELRKFTDAGGQLRVISTTYLGATQAEAIEKLAELQNTQIKISYDVEHTRLHAKSYIFHRKTGYSTAYVGSSNMTRPAMTSGLEWNVKVTKKDLPEVFNKVIGSFDGYWNSDEFDFFTKEKSEMLRKVLNGSSNQPKDHREYFFDIKPYPYQQAILDKLTAEREVHNNYKNLIVAATGCGKTIIAAFDYKRQCINEKKPKLLFIAHRQEILKQSIDCFREVLRDSEFGDLCVGNYVPEQYDYLFMSRDMFNSKRLWEVLAPDAYDFIIIDECHHAAARSYEVILNHFTPKILLGLTATPERNDGDDILRFFNNRISAEIRLPEAIDRKLLAPFHYFIVADETDLSKLKWQRGGYDSSELENVYVFNTEIAKKRARLIFNSLEKYVLNLETVKALAFCVSVEHAKFMEKMFQEFGIAAKSLVGGASDQERASVKNQLSSGEIKIVCVVDIYNEGVDIKDINTVLFLRPTESLTVFLQQMGRGLRLAEGKDCLTVLDFVGQANKNYSFANKYSALLEGNNTGIANEIRNDFISLPKGCYIKMQKKAKDIILNNIRNIIGTKQIILEKIRTFEDDYGKQLTLNNFINTYDISTRNIYSCKTSFTQAIALALGTENKINDDEAWKKLYHLALIDDQSFLEYMIEHLTEIENVNKHLYDKKERDYLRILYVSLFEEKPENDGMMISKIIHYFKSNEGILDEIIELFTINYEAIDFVGINPMLPYDNSLKVYCTYTRAQALALLDYWSTSSEGVTRVAEKKTTCLFITLNKSNSYYSPTTQYHDYSISANLFHWQSQNATADYTAVGRRYTQHRKQGETILLFVRDAKEDKLGSIPFTFLGSAVYVEHSGNKPMNIVWRLNNPIPAKYLKITDKLGIG